MIFVKKDLVLNLILLFLEILIQKEYVNNKLYIVIGSKAAKVFFPREKFNDLVFKNNYINGKLTIVLPHPSPLNIKWFKDHPEFMNERIYEVRNIINKTLDLD